MAAKKKVLRWLVLADAVAYGKKWYARGEEFSASYDKVAWLAEKNKIALIQGE